MHRWSRESQCVLLGPGTGTGRRERSGGTGSGTDRVITPRSRVLGMNSGMAGVGLKTVKQGAGALSSPGALHTQRAPGEHRHESMGHP